MSSARPYHKWKQNMLYPMKWQKKNTICCCTPKKRNVTIGKPAKKMVFSSPLFKIVNGFLSLPYDTQIQNKKLW
jgi:hypothetical protein